MQARPAPWGLVSAIVKAYNRHHELVLRPDDLWQAILTQFSFYVNGHAEDLRDRFVDFKGKKTLVVEMEGTLFTADYAKFAHRMVHENIVHNIKDPSVVEWILPKFTTTTWTDQVTASVSLMSTLKAYFEYIGQLACGIPKVTLIGTPEDWKCLRVKVDRLLDYDLRDTRMTAWHQLLAPVLDEFVKSASGDPSIAFWDRVCSHHGGGSGPSYLSGWVTVFAVFNSDGEWQPNRSQVPYPMIDFDSLPVGVVSVPVLVDDNGTQYDTQLLGGQFAFEEAGSEGVAIQPRTDWCIAYLGKPNLKTRSYTHGEVRMT